jgi:hypothetical protein
MSKYKQKMQKISNLSAQYDNTKDNDKRKNLLQQILQEHKQLEKMILQADQQSKKEFNRLNSKLEKQLGHLDKHFSQLEMIQNIFTGNANSSVDEKEVEDLLSMKKDEIRLERLDPRHKKNDKDEEDDEAQEVHNVIQSIRDANRLEDQDIALANPHLTPEERELKELEDELDAEILPEEYDDIALANPIPFFTPQEEQEIQNELADLLKESENAPPSIEETDKVMNDIQHILDVAAETKNDMVQECQEGLAHIAKTTNDNDAKEALLQITRLQSSHEKQTKQFESSSVFTRGEMLSQQVQNYANTANHIRENLVHGHPDKIRKDPTKRNIVEVINRCMEYATSIKATLDSCLNKIKNIFSSLLNPTDTSKKELEKKPSTPKLAKKERLAELTEASHRFIDKCDAIKEKIHEKQAHLRSSHKRK